MASDVAQRLRELIASEDVDGCDELFEEAAATIEQLQTQVFTRVNRVEVIDSIGRAYTNYDVQVGSCYAYMQDDQKTLKVFVTTRSNDVPRGPDDYHFKL